MQRYVCTYVRCLSVSVFSSESLIQDRSLSCQLKLCLGHFTLRNYYIESTHTHTHIHTNSIMHSHTYAQTHTHIHAHTYTHNSHARTHTHTHIHTHTHTNTHTHTHTHAQAHTFFKITISVLGRTLTFVTEIKNWGFLAAAAP